MTQPDATQAPVPMTRAELLERLQKHLTGTILAFSVDGCPDAVQPMFAVMHKMIDETERAWGEAEA